MKHIDRRTFLEMLGAAALAPAGCLPRRSPSASPPVPRGALLNDVHSQLNETRVARVVPVRSVDDVLRVVAEARRDGSAISIAGGRHSMGGQQFGAGTVHLDTSGMSRLLSLDRQTGVVDVEAGIHWPQLIAGYVALQRGDAGAWGIRQKQTGADELAIGGALSANAHGRGLALRPMVGDVESFTLVCADGQVRRCSRSENAELFSLAIGGYGLFGVITSVRLRLARRQKLERVVEIRHAEEIAAAFAGRIRDGYPYGDFQFETDEKSPTFLTRGVFACYRPVAETTPMPERQAELGYDDWMRLLYLGHVNKAEAFALYSRHYLSTSGQLYWTDTNQLSLYPDGYHRLLDRQMKAATPGSEMITEVYVPRDQLFGFLQEAAAGLRREQANVIYGTVRLIERDEESFLRWARESYACIVFNLHVRHSASGIAGAKRSFRLLIDLAERRGGTYYLTYHRWATREQLLRGYPQMPEFLRAKREYDPEQRFQSDWYRHQRSLLADAGGAR